MKPAYIVVLIAIFLACTPQLSSATERQRGKALDRYARRMNLALTPQVRPRVIKRITAYECAALVAGICGVAVGYAVSLILPGPSEPGSGNTAPLFVAVAVGLGVGVMMSTVATATVAILRSEPERRIARTSVPAVADYVAALERWSAPLALGCAGLALLGAVIALGTGVHHSDELNLIGGCAFFLFIVAAVVLISLDGSSRPSQHYGRRLWQHSQPTRVRQ